MRRRADFRSLSVESHDLGQGPGVRRVDHPSAAHVGADVAEPGEEAQVA